MKTFNSGDKVVAINAYKPLINGEIYEVDYTDFVDIPEREIFYECVYIKGDLTNTAWAIESFKLL